MKKLLLPLLISSTLIACGGGGGGSSTETNTTNVSTNSPTISTTPSESESKAPLSVVGGFSNANESSTLLISESGFVLFGNNNVNSVFFGDVVWSGSTGTGSLREFNMNDQTYSEERVITTLSLSSDNKISATFTVSSTTISDTFDDSKVDNSEFKKDRNLSSYDGTWFEYQESNPTTLTFKDGQSTFIENIDNCTMSISAKDDGFTYSEFLLTATATNCATNTNNGTFDGIMFSGTATTDNTEDVTIFTYNDRVARWGFAKRL